ncbi:hypothetical protein G6F32_016988 [Rhizopus arrhizus]|nr:hypothetical protein G6F32_016988 [Rhizopus arrhizus]
MLSKDALPLPLGAALHANPCSSGPPGLCVAVSSFPAPGSPSPHPMDPFETVRRYPGLRSGHLHHESGWPRAQSRAQVLVDAPGVAT